MISVDRELKAVIRFNGDLCRYCAAIHGKYCNFWNAPKSYNTVSSCELRKYIAREAFLAYSVYRASMWRTEGSHTQFSRSRQNHGHTFVLSGWGESREDSAAPFAVFRFEWKWTKGFQLSGVLDTACLQVNVNTHNGVVYLKKYTLDTSVSHQFGSNASPWWEWKPMTIATILQKAHYSIQICLG